MPLQKLQFRPGVSRESTDYANEGGWYSCDKVRFRSGQPEKIGGWTLVAPGTFLGECRCLVEWETLAQPVSFLLLGLGTNLKFYILSNQTYFDITPLAVPAINLDPDPFQTIYSTLDGSISDTVTNITVVDGGNFGLVTPLIVRIDSEEIYVTNVSGNILAGCVRGYNGTTAASHSSGTPVTSSWMLVYSPGNGSAAGNFVTLSGADAFDIYTELQLNKNFEIKGVSGDYIAVDVLAYATADDSGGGSTVVAEYEIAVGNAIATFGNGWGTGVWIALELGAGTGYLTADINETQTTIPVDSTSDFDPSGYIVIDAEVIEYTGTTSTTFTGCIRSTENPTTHGNGVTIQGVIYAAPSRGWGTPATSDVGLPMRIWSADTFGQDLVMNIRDSAVYYWEKVPNTSPTGDITGRAVNIIDLPSADAWAPDIASRVFVTDERHIVALGTNDPTATSPASQDPLFIRWSDQENPKVWLPTATNSAGFQRVSYGSKLITAEKTRQEILIWSDSALYSMRYLGPPYTYGFNVISAEINIAGPNAVATANNITYWMGIDKFYAYSGRVDTVPCSLRQYIFDDINLAQIEQVYSGGNEKYNEVWWYYPSAESLTCDRYAVYNYLEKLWYYGQLPRTAWYDSHIRSFPIATGAGKLYFHDFGVDDASTNPVTPVTGYIESADFDIGEGEQYSFVKRLIPDVDFIGSSSSNPSVTMSISVRDFPGQGVVQTTDTAVVASSQVSVQVYNYTNDVWIRLRGRQVSFRISSDALGTRWQLGVPRLDVQPDGRKSR